MKCLLMIDMYMVMVGMNMAVGKDTIVVMHKDMAVVRKDMNMVVVCKDMNMDVMDKWVLVVMVVKQQQQQ